MTTTTPTWGIATIAPRTKPTPSAPPKKAHHGAERSPIKPTPVPPKAPVAIMHKRRTPPERKEIAALSTGESTARRNRALTGPWIDIQKPAKIITRIGRKRIEKNESSSLRGSAEHRLPGIPFFGKALIPPNLIMQE